MEGVSEGKGRICGDNYPGTISKTAGLIRFIRIGKIIFITIVIIRKWHYYSLTEGYRG